MKTGIIQVRQLYIRKAFVLHSQARRLKIQSFSLHQYHTCSNTVKKQNQLVNAILRLGENEITLIRY